MEQDAKASDLEEQELRRFIEILVLSLAPKEQIVLDTLLKHVNNVLNNLDDTKVRKVLANEGLSPITSKIDALSLFTKLGWEYNEKENAYILSKPNIEALRYVKRELAEAKPKARAVINFYRERDAYGQFSNFSPHPIDINGMTWPTTEHYFQGQKFPGTELEESIRKARDPSIAKKLGQSRHVPLRSDWETVKDSIMWECLYAKFTQHPALRKLLLSTDDAILVEHTKNDYYWGDGGDGSGQNKLGKSLMSVREAIRRNDTNGEKKST